MNGTQHLHFSGRKCPCVRVWSHAKHGRGRFCGKGQELSDGTAMPVGELQEDLHLGEGLPVIRGLAILDL
jgi:hypothetical protein